MYGTYLIGTSLSGATLTGVSLSDTILSGADLHDARLRGAILSGAHLTGIDLSGADLSGADLSGADLSGADLSGADLSGALLTGAVISQAQLDAVYSCRNAAPPTASTGLICHQIPNIELTYWYTEADQEKGVIRNLIDQFERQNPRIKINAVPEPFFHTRAAFTTAVQDGNAPDILRSDVGWIKLFASKGYLLNIDRYVSQGDLTDYQSTPLEYGEYDGHLYGLPQVIDFLGLMYNKKELAQAGITTPPSTMAAFEADVVKVAQSKAAKYGFETNGSFYNILPFLYAYGGRMFDQHNNILVNNAGSVKGLGCLLHLEDNTFQAMPPAADISNGVRNTVSDFKKGTTAMIFDGPYDVSEILTGRSFKKDPGNLGIVGVPAGPTGERGSPLGGQSYVISAGTTHPDEAFKFISFMSSKASQIAIAEANHTLPTRQSAYQGEFSNDPFISAFLQIRATGVARPAIPQGGYLFDVADPSIRAALNGMQTATYALNAIAHSWNQLGAGKQISQSTFTPDASQTACS